MANLESLIISFSSMDGDEKFLFIKNLRLKRKITPPKRDFKRNMKGKTSPKRKTKGNVMTVRDNRRWYVLSTFY